MNIQSNFKNEDFLADCATNVFFLTELRGLKWKKYASNCENVTCTSNDPILTAYSTAVQCDVLCVWHRNQHTVSVNEESNTQLFNSPKELFIFWYGDEPVLQDVPSDLIKEVESGTYENGMTGDLLQVFFTAIHKVIERNLLNGKFMRLGKWFTEKVDCDENNNARVSSLAFCFSIFIHGESAVVASVSIQEKAAVRSLRHEDLQKIHQNQQQTKVLLGPYGLDALLTGHSLADTDSKSVKLIDEWKKFVPSVKPQKFNLIVKEEKCPCVVEVKIGGSKVLYPSSLVLVPMTREAPMTTPTQSQQFKVSEVVNKVWKKIRQKEEQHAPKEQLWDFKETCYQSNCSCSSNSNTTRAKSSSNNPFSSSHNNQSNNQSTQKSKNSSTTRLSCFHERQIKLEKLRLTPTLSGRLTPSLGGRSTPLMALTKPSTPLSTKNEDTVFSMSHFDSKPKVFIPSIHEETKNNSLAVLKVSTFAKPTLPKPRVKMKTKKSKAGVLYSLPTSLNIKPPKLSSSVLEPRTDDLVVPDEKVDVKPVLSHVLDEKPTIPGVKRPQESLVNDSNAKKIKKEVVESTTRRGPGRPKGASRRSSVLSPSDTSGNDTIDTLPPRRTSSRRITSPRSDSPPISATKGRKKTRTPRSVKTPNTPKTETQVFDFSSKLSPTQMHFSPPPSASKASSTMWTSTKDIMPNIADLQNMFDCDEVEEIDPVIKKIPSATDPVVSSEDSTIHLKTSNLTTTTAAGLTAHDLAQMFPTPPSQDPPLQTMSPMSIHTEVLPAGQTLTSMSVLSPEMHHSSGIDAIDEPYSPFLDTSTFKLPRLQALPIPTMYTPIILPQRNYKKNVKLKYTPSWDSCNAPPILSRRPSSTKSSTNNEHVLDRPLSHKLADISPIKSKIIDKDDNFSLTNLSLVENLLLADTETNRQKSRFSGKFNQHRNSNWKKSPLTDADSQLFPEDSYSVPLNDICEKVETKDSEDLKFATHNLSIECLELFMQNLSSPSSTKYLFNMLRKYYCIHKVTDKPSFPVLLEQDKLLKELHPHLEKALLKATRKSVWDTPKVKGPLSFNKLNDISNKMGVTSSVSTNPLSFSYDGDALCVSPSALKYWQPMHLEPHSGIKNVAYIVALPDSDFIVSSTRQFFKEFNAVYESMNLGKHSPIVKDLRNGLIRITQKYFQKVSETQVDDWFSQSDSKLMQKLKVVAQFCKQQLGPYLASLSLDSTLYTTKSEVGSTAGSKNNVNTANSGTAIATYTPASVYDDTPTSEQKKSSIPTIVIYMIDPFHSNDEKNNSFPQLWSFLGMMKCFTEMSPTFDKLKDNIILQIIPLEQILELNLSSRSQDTSGNQNPELRNLALNIYARCRVNPFAGLKKNEKAMTGFGMSNCRESLIHRRQMENKIVGSLFMAPYILSERFSYMKSDTQSLSDSKTSLMLKEPNVNILFCSYCLSYDDQWLLVTCTDKCGELNETNFIKITYPKRKKNKSVIWNVTMRKLLEYIMGLMSYTVLSWRVVITKLGEVGQAEFKELENLIQSHMQSVIPSHQGSRPQSPLATDICTPCSLDEKRKGQCLFKSISLCNVTKNTNIQFASVKLTRHMGMFVSRVFVTPPPKSYLSRNQLKSTTNSHEMLIPDNTTLLNNSFDEDTYRDFSNVLPMLSSPSDSSIFPHTSPEISKMLSPPFAPSMPSLSPFQPIQAKDLFVSPNNKVNELNEQQDCLAVGYLLSGASLHGECDQPHIFKSDLLIHKTASTSTSSNLHPLNSNNNLEVLRCILEHFDHLSWLTVDASTGKRTSCLPVHISNLVLIRQLMVDISS